ncbi:hypothetical protein DEI81_13290 [Curtobacterium sp. MCBD17_013]|nr:hypothetical protein DEI81_13290 [Curtobacterium sp. MCBD17_013]
MFPTAPSRECDEVVPGVVSAAEAGFAPRSSPSTTKAAATTVPSRASRTSAILGARNGLSMRSPPDLAAHD